AFGRGGDRAGHRPVAGIDVIAVETRDRPQRLGAGAGQIDTIGAHTAGCGPDRAVHRGARIDVDAVAAAGEIHRIAGPGRGGTCRGDAPRLQSHDRVLPGV